MVNWWLVLSAGLLAGATTCAVTQGGLLVGLIARQRKAAGLPAGRTTAADDLAPVGGFLAGKLLSHTLLGGVLGALGTAFGFDPRVGAVALLVAGALLLMLGLGSLGVPVLRDVKFTPPDSWLAVVRGQTRSKSAAAPFLLGVAVLLVPCGVTLSMEVLAATSGSALTGALVMAVFVLGTAPLFTLYGYLSQKLPFGRAMSTALGALVVVFGLVTVNAGLVAAGSPVSFGGLPGFGAPAVTAAPPPSGAPGQAQDVRVQALNGGYSPQIVTASAQGPVRLTFTTDKVASCILSTALPTLGKQVILPSSGSKTLDLGKLAPGDYPISCSMGMYTATLRVVA